MAAETPKGFPLLTLSTMRTVCALSVAYHDKLIPAFDALFESHWADGNTGIGKPEGFGPIFETLLGKDRAAEVMKRATEKEAKDLLVKNSDMAFEDGAFRLPWFVCTNAEGKVEKFWGCDHLGQVVDFLGLDRENSKGSSAKKGWRAVL